MSPQPKVRTARLRLGRALLLVLLAVVLGWVLYRTVISPRAFAAAATPPDQIVLWEGLPRPGSERGRVREERNSKPTRELYGYSFYQADIPLLPEDVAVLTRLLGDSRSYTPYWPVFSAKLCGGFHPDYAIELRRHGQVHYALLCFGCGEVELRGGWIHSRHEISTYATLKALLSKYRRSRPASEIRPDGSANMAAPTPSANIPDPPASGVDQP